MEEDIKILINMVAFIIISLSCFKFFKFSNGELNLSEKENNIKQKNKELIKLKKEIEYITNKFNTNYTKAKRGELHKADSIHKFTKNKGLYVSNKQ